MNGSRLVEWNACSQLSPTSSGKGPRLELYGALTAKVIGFQVCDKLKEKLCIELVLTDS